MGGAGGGGTIRGGNSSETSLNGDSGGDLGRKSERPVGAPPPRGSGTQASEPHFAQVGLSPGRRREESLGPDACSSGERRNSHRGWSCGARVRWVGGPVCAEGGPRMPARERGRVGIWAAGTAGSRVKRLHAGPRGRPSPVHTANRETVPTPTLVGGSSEFARERAQSGPPRPMRARGTASAGAGV